MLDFAIPQIVAVLTPRRLAEDIAVARKCKPNVVEYRADLQDCIDADAIVQDLAIVRKKLNLPILFTLRDKSEGGEFSGLPARRVQICAAAAPHVNAMDIEVAHARAFVSIPRKVGDHTVSTVLSYHNFSATPSDDDLDRIVNKGVVGGADAVKIATSCVTRFDALRLLSLSARAEEVPVIVVGMGPFGTMVRMIAPLFGSVIGYASLSEPVAPGQLPVEDLRRAWAMLGVET